MPLSVAATVAYYHLADAKLRREDADNLARVTGLAAVSLCQVAMIFLGVPGRPPRAMTSDEVHRLLCRPMLDAELVPLSVAATVAYYHLSGAKLQREDADNLAREIGRAHV